MYVASTHVKGEELRRTRQKRAMSIRELSEESGVHRNLISRIENGHVNSRPKTVRSLASALDIEPHELLQ